MTSTDAVPPSGTVLPGLTEVLGDVAGVDPADVTPEARLGNDLGIDSLTLVEGRRGGRGPIRLGDRRR
jgi:hypothetical protein